ncbi:aldehyde reductase [Hypoxylon cercidicola]|nr:aldehyde reductase [Hypoxylon cercidicola]
MAVNKPQLIFGAAMISSDSGFDTTEKVQSFLDTLLGLGIDTLDTAFIYGDSEEQLGKANASARFLIDTKFPGGFVSDSSSKDKVIETGQLSLQRLKTDSVNVYYQHAPEPATPLEDTLAGVNELYKSGAFKHFGLSNFSAADVEEVIRISKEKSYVLPTVYQGNYSAFARHTETEIFPVLRKHGIRFYAYSPSAGGFLAKKAETLRSGGSGRWHKDNQYGKLYNTLYSKEVLLDGLDSWNEVAAGEGVTGIQMAYRWITYHSKLDASLDDGIILGARNAEQLREIMAWIQKGPLGAEVATKIDAIWDKISADAPLDNYHSYHALQPKA